MNGAHFHLAISHFPVVGMIIGLLIYAIGLFKKNDEVINVSLHLFILNLIFVAPTYFSGDAAEEIIEHLPGFDETFIEKHEQIASISFGAVILVGIQSALNLFLYRRNKNIPHVMKNVFLILILTASGLLAWTANRGGQIHHDEIRSRDSAGSVGSQIEGSLEQKRLVN